ncbi:putative metalloprotease CJM1_0395 family protein [Rugamonas apoptosis]|uniref:putative metalloprotease CJM1_0395 family protein n=1 Tax=Rugamonas apoptosis TaxID=2758570 RepID=UPI001E2FFF0B|nr:putative metalloprotease CJM1_0395 family protein [Rugamonas apoptosis]
MSTAAIPASARVPAPPATSNAVGQGAPGARAGAGMRAGAAGDHAQGDGAAAAPSSAPSTSAATTTAASSSTTLTPQALALIDRLKARDTEVRQHELAHLAAAGGLAVSGAAYTYQRGPNGVDYAIGGEVHIDTSPGRTPEETIARARTIQAAALAPADPSGPDRAVAAQAQQLEQQARAELAVQAAQQAVAGHEPADSARPAKGAGQDKGAPPVAGRPLAPGVTDGAQVAPLQQPPSAESVRRAYEAGPLARPRLDVVA